MRKAQLGTDIFQSIKDRIPADSFLEGNVVLVGRWSVAHDYANEG